MKLLDLLVQDCKRKGITAISLEATDMGRSLYEKYGFVRMDHEMELPDTEIGITWTAQKDDFTIK